MAPSPCATALPTSSLATIDMSVTSPSPRRRAKKRVSSRRAIDGAAGWRGSGMSSCAWVGGSRRSRGYHGASTTAVGQRVVCGSLRRYAWHKSLRFSLSALDRKRSSSEPGDGHGMSPDDAPLDGPALTTAISAAMVDLYGRHYRHERTSASTYINDNVVVCILEDILSTEEYAQVAAGDTETVIDGRVAFQTETEDQFTHEVERLTRRRVVAFMSANQTTPGIACELFYLDAAP